MKIELKPLWVEGTMLSQQHFQQWENYYSAVNKFHFELTSNDQWGLVALTIESEALLRHHLIISRCEVMFKNLELCCDELSEDILSLDLSQQNQATLSIYLCVVDDDKANGITGYPKYTQAVRWSAQYSEVADHLDNQRRHEVLLATNNLYLSTEETNKKSIQYFKLLQLSKDSDGFYRIDECYIPPLIVLTANRYLSQKITSIEVALRHKQVDLRGDLSASHQYDINRWTLTEISRCVNKLVHYRQQRYTPLNDYYQCLLDLAIFLQMVTNRDEHIIESDYRHDDLAHSFVPLCDLINRCLSQINSKSPEKVIQIRKTSKLMYCIEWHKSPIQALRLYLLIKNNTPSDDWQQRFLKQTTLAATSVIELCIASAVQGLELVYYRQYPATIERVPGWDCFAIIIEDDGWQSIRKDKSLSIFLSDEFSTVDIKVVASDE